jgi:hypothetical protein
MVWPALNQKWSGMRADPYNVRFLRTMRLAFVPNQHGLRLNDAEIRVLTPRRKREGGAQGNANNCYRELTDAAFHRSDELTISL